MRITDRYQHLIERVAPGVANDATKTEDSKSSNGPKAMPKTGGSGIEVKVSPRAQELADEAVRIEELRARVREGTFHIDYQRIASRILGGEDDG